jgi:hypothetical protein
MHALLPASVSLRTDAYSTITESRELTADQLRAKFFAALPEFHAVRLPLALPACTASLHSIAGKRIVDGRMARPVGPVECLHPS